jgi:hypothetical protein
MGNSLFANSEYTSAERFAQCQPIATEVPERPEIRPKQASCRGLELPGHAWRPRVSGRCSAFCTNVRLSGLYLRLSVAHSGWSERCKYLNLLPVLFVIGA